ncbi:hypothetical protein CkaCkLH20_09447 [Colletotrichum karsti]|uniref:Uncharacterized protein n=1 Tax=Colletotrichum karsti TaxID=1095194 RepID=A0A9P6HXA4_9PEZI|nr:uncharacterized protein CkaCkLH20_09447 [Colletotrichum karsti]KAF9872937.1 hypothetical protein CkaCkLH20_09447 [Colletotrichum karsti]
MASPDQAMPKEWSEKMYKIREWFDGDENVRLAHIQTPPGCEKDARLIQSLQQMIAAKTSGQECDNHTTSYMLRSREEAQKVADCWSKQQDDSLPQITTYKGLRSVFPGRTLDCKHLLIIDVDETLGFNYARLAMELSELICDWSESAILRVAWISPNPIDQSLSKMVSVFLDADEVDIATFQLPQLDGKPTAGSFKWKVYRADYQRFLQEAATVISQDYGLQDDKASNTKSPFKRTRTGVYYDALGPTNLSHRPDPFHERLTKLAVKSFVVQGDEEPLATDTGAVVMLPAFSTSKSRLPDGVQHLVLCKERVVKRFDPMISRVVNAVGLASKSELNKQIQRALEDEGVSSNLTIHSQLSMEEIQHLGEHRVFEDQLLDAFILWALVQYPSLSTDRLATCFIRNRNGLHEALGNLTVLGCLERVVGTEAPIKVTYKLTELGRWTCRWSALTDYDVSCAILLGYCSDERISPVLRLAIVQIVAIVLRFQGTTAFFRLRWEAELTNGILAECRDVPVEAIRSSAIWMALAIYRLYLGYPKISQRQADSGNLTIDLAQCTNIHVTAESILLKLREGGLEPEIDPEQSLDMDLMGQLEYLMVKAWLHRVVYLDGPRSWSVLSKTPLMCDKDDVILDWDRMKGGFGLFFFTDREESIYKGRLLTTVPTATVVEAFQELGLKPNGPVQFGERV